MTDRTNTVALIVPVHLAGQATKILNQRRCNPLALVHPDTPEHRGCWPGSATAWRCRGHPASTGPLAPCRCRPPPSQVVRSVGCTRPERTGYGCAGRLVRLDRSRRGGTHLICAASIRAALYCAMVKATGAL